MATRKDVLEWICDLPASIEIKIVEEGKDYGKYHYFVFDLFTQRHGFMIDARDPRPNEPHGRLYCLSTCECIEMDGPLNREGWDQILAAIVAHEIKCEDCEHKGHGKRRFAARTQLERYAHKIREAENMKRKYASEAGTYRELAEIIRKRAAALGA